MESADGRRRVNKLTRFAERIRQPEWRKYGFTLFTGKILGLFLAVVAILIIAAVMGGDVKAAEPLVKGNDVVNPLNTVWTLLGAFLVFAMQSGFTMLEAGFCRARETVNVLVECVVDTCLCGILFYAVGFGLMFGSGTPFFGTQYFFLQGIPETYGSTGVAFLAFWVFQYAFADTCSTITDGSMCGRTSFVGDLIYSVLVTGFIYPIIGHWAWGPDGFLATMGTPGHFLPGLGMGFHDFAGSTVVHTIGGMIAFAGAIVLGPRIGRRFKRDGGGPMLPHDLTIATIGGLILWFGWYGFNPGSTLSAMDFVGIGRVAANTTIAACAGCLAALIYGYPKAKKWDLSYSVNGMLAGLVAITCPCYWVSPFGSLIIGTVGGVLVVAGCDLLEWLRVDDPCGATAVHGFCGIWGTLSLGLFACGYGVTGVFGPDNSAPLVGLFYGGGTTVLVAQIIGSAIVTVVTLSVALAMYYGIKAIGLLRVEREGELQGLDLFEHGIPAYPEYALHAAAMPRGTQAFNVAAFSTSAPPAPEKEIVRTP